MSRRTQKYDPEKRNVSLCLLKNIGPAFTVPPEYSACKGKFKKTTKKNGPRFWGLQDGGGGIGGDRAIDGHTIPIFPPCYSQEKKKGVNI